MFVQKRSLIILTILWLFVVNASATQTAVIRVPADQPTIQAAINAAVSGDTVLVGPGTYIENLNFLGKAIRVTSEQGPQLTVVDGNQAGSVVAFVSGESPQSVLSGFTLRNGRAASSPALRGGGIRIENSSPTIVGNLITENTAGDGGGGISSSFGSPVIQGNTISNNGQISGWSGGVGGGGISIVGNSSAQVLNNIIMGNSWASASGGGVTLFAAGTPTLANNFITGNTAFSQGGGVWMANQSDASIVQNIIAGNRAARGGGINWLVPSGARGPYLINNTIAENDSPQGSGIFADGFDRQVQLINNIVVAKIGQNAVTCGTFDANPPTFQFNNIASTTSGQPYAGTCTDQTGLNGNISSDPMFRDPAAGDYHLQAGSPAIDSGTNNLAPLSDLDGVARPADGNADGDAAFDMGVYEAPLLDVISPVTTAGITPLPNTGGWNITNVTVTLDAADAGGSGVEFIRYSLSGAQVSPVVNGSDPVSVTVTMEGTTTLSYYAMDNAGNVEAQQSLDVRIDKTNPAISGMPAPGCTLSPARHQLIQVATVTATDSVSGIAALTVTATSNEPDSGTGGGDVAGDIVINGGSITLRAERAPSSKGRIYTITAVATDLAGNITNATATCTVPK